MIAIISHVIYNPTTKEIQPTFTKIPYLNLHCPVLQPLASLITMHALSLSETIRKVLGPRMQMQTQAIKVWKKPVKVFQLGTLQDGGETR